VCGAQPPTPKQLTPAPCLAPPAPCRLQLFRRRCRHDWRGLGRHARGGAAAAGQRRLLPAAALKHVLLTALAVNARRVARQLRLRDGGRRATASEVIRGTQVGHDKSGGGQRASQLVRKHGGAAKGTTLCSDGGDRARGSGRTQTSDTTDIGGNARRAHTGPAHLRTGHLEDSSLMRLREQRCTRSPCRGNEVGMKTGQTSEGASTPAAFERGGHGSQSGSQ